jgi:hypothetical protein
MGKSEVKTLLRENYLENVNMPIWFSKKRFLSFAIIRRLLIPPAIIIDRTSCAALSAYA